VSRGLELLREMSHFGVQPEMKHHVCVIDLLARAGNLAEAEAHLRAHPEAASSPAAYVALLGGCRKHADALRGARIYKEMCALPNFSPEYLASSTVLMSNILQETGRSAEGSELHGSLLNRKIHKLRGVCTIELDGDVHVIGAHEQSHPDSALMHQKMHELAEQMQTAGYKPRTEHAMLEANSVEALESHLCSHSEKLTIAYALCRLPPNAPIEFVKNLRVCIDCHEATKFLSKMLNRKISVRDANVWHNYVDGECSCEDYF